jgi:putative transposase
VGPTDASPRGRWVVWDRGLTVLSVAARADGTEVGRVDADQVRWAAGRVRPCLAYKRAGHGGQLLVADRWLASSKTCSPCGALRPGLGLGLGLERTYRRDGSQAALDHDLNATVNLAVRAEKHHAQGPGPRSTSAVTHAHRKARAGRHSGDGETGWKRGSSRPSRPRGRINGGPRRAVPNHHRGCPTRFKSDLAV